MGLFTLLIVMNGPCVKKYDLFLLFLEKKSRVRCNALFMTCPMMIESPWNY